MQNIEIVILFLLFAIVAILVYVFFLKREEKRDDSGLVLLQERLDRLTRTLDERMGETSDRMYESLERQSETSRKLVQEIRDKVEAQLLGVVKGVTEVSESSKQVFTLAEQLKNLEKVLKNQKQRGNLGEASLELILSNVLPGQYEAQHPFKDGEKVDFVIKTAEGLVPVDAKFPLENYIRLVDEADDVRKEVYRKDFKSDVKKRIDETAKYIRPGEGTLPFAFMFIPAEAIYYDLLNSDVGIGVNSRDLIDYAYQQKNVLIVSPTTFLAYLQTVLFGNQRMKVQEAAKDIIKNVENLSRHMKAYDDYFKKVGNTLNTTVNHYNNAQKELAKIDKDVLRITGDSMDIEQLALERPQAVE
ncbi:MAG TPA: DNA recombination protein RmuC [Candidatus Paceibacterota bacterium]|nr:DNA recombination protein RmuC [Candidatus Paceibacterota bacterium]